MWSIKFNSGGEFRFNDEEHWEQAIQEMAEETPYDFDVDYYNQVCWVDDGDFEEPDDLDWDNDFRDEDGF